MKRVKITIKTVNEAFVNDPESEAARILKDIASKLYANAGEQGDWTIRDINGNSVGKLEVR